MDYSSDTYDIDNTDDSVVHVSTPESLIEELPVDQDELVLLIDRLIVPRVNKLCKEYCYQNRRQYKCTLDKSWGSLDQQAALCDWGNGTYTWMLEELLHIRRLEKLVNAENAESIQKYYSKIIHSLPFFERFKNWRFQRRIQIPSYIKAIDPLAHKVFWSLIDYDSVENMAQRLGRSEKDIATIIRKINIQLQKHNSRRLIEPAVLISMTSITSEVDDGVVEMDIADNTNNPEENALKQQTLRVLQMLDWKEQFVVKSMIIQGISANDVLAVLVEQNISVVSGTEPEQQNTAQLYYFLRKCITKLQTLCSKGNLV